MACVLLKTFIQRLDAVGAVMLLSKSTLVSWHVVRWAVLCCGLQR
jgi:hypothetical protein